MKRAQCTGGFGGLVLALITILPVGAAQAAADDLCRVEAGNANDAAQRYRAAAREVGHTCTKVGGDCTGAESQAAIALLELVNAHQAMLNTCPTGGPSSPPPAAPAPTIPGDLVITEIMPMPICIGG